MVRATCTPGSGRHSSTEAKDSFWVFAFPLPSWLAAFIGDKHTSGASAAPLLTGSYTHGNGRPASIACGAPVEEALAYSVPRSRLTCVILGMLSHPGGSGFGLPVRHEAR